jgi:large subunit ribosomal protein L4
MNKPALNIALIKQVVLAKQANARQSTSSTKTRGKVSGGGKKPWKQKGTGRARAGSSRSPIWIGGGITFGPSKDRTFAQKLPKKMVWSALKQLLNHANETKQVLVVASLALAEPKTKLALALLAKYELTGKRTLMVTKDIQPELILATNNIRTVTVCRDQDLSVMHLVNQPTVIMEQAVYDHRFGTKKATPAEKAVAPKTKKSTATKAVKKESK